MTCASSVRLHLSLHPSLSSRSCSSCTKRSARSRVPPMQSSIARFASSHPRQIHTGYPACDSASCMVFRFSDTRPPFCFLSSGNNPGAFCRGTARNMSGTPARTPSAFRRAPVTASRLPPSGMANSRGHAPVHRAFTSRTRPPARHVHRHIGSYFPSLLSSGSGRNAMLQAAWARCGRPLSASVPPGSRRYAQTCRMIASRQRAGSTCRQFSASPYFLVPQFPASPTASIITGGTRAGRGFPASALHLRVISMSSLPHIRQTIGPPMSQSIHSLQVIRRPLRLSETVPPSLAALVHGEIRIRLVENHVRRPGAAAPSLTNQHFHRRSG